MRVPGLRLRAASLGLWLQTRLHGFACSIDPLVHRREQDRDARRFYLLHLAPRILEIGDLPSEWDQLRGFGLGLCLYVHLSELMLQIVFEEEIIDAAIFTHRLEYLPGDNRQPIIQKLLEPLLPRRGVFDIVEAVQRAAIHSVALDQRLHLALGCIEIVGARAAYCRGIRR